VVQQTIRCLSLDDVVRYRWAWHMAEEWKTLYRNLKRRMVPVERQMPRLLPHDPPSHFTKAAGVGWGLGD